jgi:hypothetical protein
MAVLERKLVSCPEHTELSVFNALLLLDARHVCGITKATSEEFDAQAEDRVIICKYPRVLVMDPRLTQV